MVMTAAISMPVGYIAGLTRDDVDGAKPGTITVHGEGRVSGIPDVLNVVFGVETREPKAADALQRSNEQAGVVIDLLKAKGVKADDIQTTDLSTYPEMALDGRMVTGYVAGNTVKVRIRKIDQAGEIIDAVAQAAGNTLRVHSLNFSIDDTDKLMEKGRKRAVDAARAQATQLAKAAGLKLGQVRSITNTSSTSQEVSDSAVSASRTAPEPGNKQFFVSVKVVYDMTR
ncbi:MAG: SIMPL domain-containing protein [Actinobacteria bacterium]|nr:SIMPL domain-containing protein [Actinomycetota bacterium]MBI3256794.1 SIMPL domain-containing protein [Actinomycetota bacterium]